MKRTIKTEAVMREPKVIEVVKLQEGLFSGVPNRI